MLSGEAVLVEDDGETVLRAGDVAAWPKGVTQRPLPAEPQPTRTAASSRSAPATARNDRGEYPDIDMMFEPDGYLRKDGTPYPPKA